MIEYISFGIIALLAGLAQGVCGFGAGILMMLVLPLFLSISRAAAVSGADVEVVDAGLPVNKNGLRPEKTAVFIDLHKTFVVFLRHLTLLPLRFR